MQNVQTRVARINARTKTWANHGKAQSKANFGKIIGSTVIKGFENFLFFYFCSFSSDLFGQQQSVLSTFEINKRTFKSPETLLGLFWALCRQTAFPHDRLKPLNLPSVCKHWRPKLRSSHLPGILAHVQSKCTYKVNNKRVTLRTLCCS